MAKTIKELTQDLLQAPSACKEVKEAAQNYLDAAGTEKEADAALLRKRAGSRYHAHRRTDLFCRF